MISKEEFIDLISNHIKWDNKLDEVEKILGIMPLEIDWIEYSAILFDKILYFLFDKETVDIITWWMWEKSENPKLKMFDENGEEIPIGTIDDLWNVIKDNRK